MNAVGALWVVIWLGSAAKLYRICCAPLQYSVDELDQIVARLPLGAAAGALAAQMWWPHAGTKLACIASCLVLCTSTIGLFVE